MYYECTLSFVIRSLIHNLVGLPCEDDSRFSRFCPGWKGKCKGTQGYFMSKYCRKTCGECGGSE